MGATRFLLATAAVVALAGCQPSGTEAGPAPTRDAESASCEQLPAVLVDAVQAYVDGFADSDPSGATTAATAARSDLQRATASVRGRADAIGCDRDDLAAGIRRELQRLTGGTPVQDAVVATFRADPLGTVDPSDPAPVDIVVAGTDELVTALALAGSGSTIRLEAGTYVLGQPLVALRPVTLVGAGRDDTVLRSIAGGAGLLVDADGDVTVTDLTVEHEGDAPASVLVVTSGGYRFERLRVSGGVSDATGAGGFGVILRPATSPLRAAGEDRSVRDVEIIGNDGGGLLVGSDAAPRVDGLTVAGDRGCGLCWAERARGTVSGATVSGLEVGVRIDDAAQPTMTGLSIADTAAGAVLTGSADPRIDRSTITRSTTGVEVAGSGSPVLSDLAVTDGADIGVRVAGSGAAVLRSVTISGVGGVGLGVTDDAEPTIEGMSVAVDGDAAAVWAGRATGSARDLDLTAAGLGLQIADRAAPVIEAVRVRGAGEAALVAAGDSGGTVTALSCPDGVPVALLPDTTVTLRRSPTCTVVDER